MQTTTNSTHPYTSAEVDAFAELVLTGGEVGAEGLVERIRRAQALLFLREDDQLLGVAALKRPNANYRLSVFEKAQVAVNDPKYPLELGWVYVVPKGRGRGLSHSLVQAAVKHANGTGIFATSRADNNAMHKSLMAASFVRHGCEYRSGRGNYKLVLFTLEPDSCPFVS